MRRVYKRLAEVYGWDANQVASMTREQQLMYLEGEESQDGKSQTFKTRAELEAFTRWQNLA